MPYLSIKISSEDKSKLSKLGEEIYELGTKKLQLGESISHRITNESSRSLSLQDDSFELITE